MKIISNASRALLTTLAFVSLAAAASAQGAVTHMINSDFSKISEVTSWINNTCKPDKASDIKAIFSQIARGGKYNIYTFCKSGTGKLGEVSSDYKLFKASEFDPDNVDRLMVNTHIIIIGFYAGLGGNELMYFTTPE